MDTETAIRAQAYITDTMERPGDPIVAMACKDETGRVYGAVIDGKILHVTPFLISEDAGREFVRRVREAVYRT